MYRCVHMHARARAHTHTHTHRVVQMNEYTEAKKVRYLPQIS